MKKIALLIASLTILACQVSAEKKNEPAYKNMTDISLQWKDSANQSSSISSETGNLYKVVKHHGPAVENEWMGLRLYFDHKVSVDVYNKTRRGLELKEGGWYPTVEQQKEGWGADQYKVGKTVGMGGIHLWDGEKEVLPDPVKMRTARVKKEGNISYMEMLSEGIPYKGDTVDLLVRVTVFSGIRAAKVEAFALCDMPVQFFTGVNYHPATEVREGDNYIATWGVHPEDVAAFQLNIGAGIMYNPADFVQKIKEPSQVVLISKPGKYLETWIVSASEKDPDLNTFDKFFEFVKNFEE